jgi:hypothetical protein
VLNFLKSHMKNFGETRVAISNGESDVSKLLYITGPEFSNNSIKYQGLRCLI